VLFRSFNNIKHFEDVSFFAFLQDCESTQSTERMVQTSAGLCFSVFMGLSVLCSLAEISVVDLSDRMQRLEDKLDAIINHLSIDKDSIGKINANTKETMRFLRNSVTHSDSNRRLDTTESVPDQMPNNWFIWALFVHEAWLFMQHANVLLNPYLQRLDRK
jgi:hypothetical protein